jgi:hypothetical protein
VERCADRGWSPRAGSVYSGRDPAMDRAGSARRRASPVAIGEGDPHGVRDAALRRQRPRREDRVEPARSRERHRQDARPGAHAGRHPLRRGGGDSRGAADGLGQVLLCGRRSQGFRGRRRGDIGGHQGAHRLPARGDLALGADGRTRRGGRERHRCRGGHEPRRRRRSRGRGGVREVHHGLHGSGTLRPTEVPPISCRA